jgi:hypothetical protein
MVSCLFLTGVKSAARRAQAVIEPKREQTEMKATTIRLDLAKTVFHVLGLPNPPLREFTFTIFMPISRTSPAVIPTDQDGLTFRPPIGNP